MQTANIDIKMTINGEKPEVYLERLRAALEQFKQEVSALPEAPKPSDAPPQT